MADTGLPVGLIDAENGIAPSTGESPILILVIRPSKLHVALVDAGNVITQVPAVRACAAAGVSAAGQVRGGGLPGPATEQAGR